MITLPHAILSALRANARASRLHEQRDERFDPFPVVKFFNPVGAATWIATELYDDGDTLFGLADLGFGCPEMGVFSLTEIAGVRLPFGLFIERDEHFEPLAPLSLWSDTARRMGAIVLAEAELRRITDSRNGNELPPPLDDRGAG
ncbi:MULTISPECIES: DUF2958 domain-containing protein [Pseudomonadota]|jgi:hypothetical protein|uniref:DUF2958 domain-containing protein n=3 Tax=Sphingomonadaceae TaxID=41297 RepID=A0A7W6GRD2_9SPHN|nr:MULTISPECIES: DUF2958 domain-containing protein [Pseudomonadota]MAF63951.1 DUF2958 domain-containing protein [Blastomonas sp.]MBA4087975.1 DUF2958 domain-containing protein [Novosphingobium sp.]MBQ94973.1 DUF2958 domain-containing protein [Actinomycetota bacterium]MBU2033646.1 DUF2958 domain-containing protein [Alphaproteobacteria bacterium]MEA3391273.1 DUF2958 domain-containing protein [Pseudomonadota bacterium]ODU68204.1 MAG: hypothetical protein ABT11_17625 [Novosphingobium sp. SCN 66-1|tara:strand:- start:23235 stop:23669 length:435 start_codon:yes stop_codon:yes gene_type:complete